MKRLLAMAAAAAALGFAAAPASAQTVTGTITLTGSVANSCAAQTGQVGANGAAPASFGDTYTFTGATALANPANGQLSATVAGYTTAAGSPVSFSYQVICNTANPAIQLTVNPMHITGAGTPPAGYTATIDYTGEVDAALAAGGTPYKATGTTAGSAVVGAKTNIGGALATTTGNIAVHAYGFTAGTSVLEAGTYTGSVVVTITPT